MSEGEKPRIIIAGKDAPIDDIRRRAEATRVSPFETLPQPITGPEGEDWAPWIVKSRKEVEDIKNDVLQVEIRRLARRPDVMVTQDTLTGSYDNIDRLVREKEITQEEADPWQLRIVTRYIELLGKDKKGSTIDKILEALPPSVAAGAVHFADELAERFPGAVSDFIKKRGKRSEEGKAPSEKKEGVGGKDEGGGPPERPPDGPPKEKDDLPDDFLKLNKLILSDKTPEDKRKRAMEKRDKMWEEFTKDNPGFVKDVTQTLLNKIRDSNWNHVKDDVRNLAIDIENEARMLGILTPETEGMLRAAIAGEALRISVIGFDKRPSKGTPQDASWLASQGQSEDGLKLDEKRVEREAFFPLGIEPHDFVGASAPKEFEPPTPEELAKLLTEKLAKQAQGEEMTDQEKREYMRRYAASPPPNEVVAIFQQGRLKIFKDSWEESVRFLDITNKEQRNLWALLNMEAFNHGIIANPHARWKGVIDFWMTDLRDATRLLPGDQLEGNREGIADTERLIKAMMAVSASARVMEITSGSTGKYATYMAPGDREGPDLDKADEWSEFLLHDDAEKLARVISNPLVRYFYTRLLSDAGYEDLTALAGKDNLTYKDILAVEKFSKDKARGVGEPEAKKKGKLIEFLRKRGLKVDKKVFEYRGGFNGYIEYLLTEDEEVRRFVKEHTGGDEVVAWSAAKLACDAFLVDKYTQWEFDMTETQAKTQNPEKWDSTFHKTDIDYGQLLPSPGWGGNPLTAMIQPMFLPRHIKRVWTGRDRAILDLADQAFHPPEMEAVSKLRPKVLVPSMVVHLKDYVRYNDALWIFLGGSRGQKIPQWTSRVMQEDLPQIVDLLDQAYGIKKPNDEPNSVAFKAVTAIMMARIIQCKTLAAAVESSRPGGSDYSKIIFDPENRDRPFLEVMQFLWGPDLDAKRGFLASMAGGRTRFIFEGSELAEFALQDTHNLLVTNDQDPKGRGVAQTVNTIGFVLDVAKAFGGDKGSRR
ncbi:hypothetical protein A2129_02345 [Candidatus Woesebacteria bacterium GWC1_42_13]|uniref:Uncharacterized protein n=2 Tax=Candidatus Woeseibacteriota TaxID=1752722 RepID=A0A1F7WUK9_9BACT|nr:MAG: hypothetical protein UV74_C0008G0002 [Candidatus Woesebacteria bacterium GW2011_GWB1_43_14]OGM06496.1 MAG: hypothetical protein A2129_02345 [Candidatus Woesebacteria bacterium GWC1_42_13]